MPRNCLNENPVACLKVMPLDENMLDENRYA